MRAKNTKPTVFLSIIITLCILFTAGCACGKGNSSGASSWYSTVSEIKASSQTASGALPESGSAGITALPYRDARLTSALAFSGFSYWYDRLESAAERELYLAVADAAFAGARSTAAVSGELTERQATDVFNAVRYDYPQLFALLPGCTVVGAEGSEAVTLRLDYRYTTVAELEAAKDEFYAAANAVLASAAKLGDIWAREAYIYEAVCGAAEYDYAEAGDIGTNLIAHTAYGCLVDGKTVCDGYAGAFALLCNYSGIEATVVTGRLDTVSHAWNMISADGKELFCDPTLDDAADLWYNGESAVRNPADTAGLTAMADGVTHAWYNLSYSEMKADHLFDASGFADTAASGAELWQTAHGYTADGAGLAALTEAVKNAKSGAVIEAAGDAKAVAAAAKAAGVKIAVITNGAGTRSAIYVL